MTSSPMAPAVFGLLVLGLCAGPATAQSGSLMRRHRSETKTALQTRIEQVLEGVPAQHLYTVEASVRPTYEAFPKNALGRIPPTEIFPAITRNYFAKEHGWVIKGLEPPSPSAGVTEVHEASVLRDGAPGLAAALKEVHDQGKGLSLSDVVGTIAAIEHLLLDESTALLRGAYALIERKTDDEIDEETVHELVQSYLLLFRHGPPHNLKNITAHQAMKTRARKTQSWKDLLQFEQEVVAKFAQKGKYSFEAVRKIVLDLAAGFGKWQNGECNEMKGTLLGMAKAGPGLVTFKDFHAEPKHVGYSFTEPFEYLQQAGVIWKAQEQDVVFVANYILGPSNCIASSAHHSVCCLNECESLLSDLEGKLQAPTSPPAKLLAVVSNIPSSSVEVPHELSHGLVDELHAIAGRHEGTVPIHSSDFKKWLHSVFPNECPFPTAFESAAEESERVSALEWVEGQQQCTRVPEWHSDVLTV